MTWLDSAIQDYYDFLKQNTVIFKTSQSDWHVISTPFIGLFNDTIDIYCREENGNIMLSDDGRTLQGLELVGASVSRSPKRREHLDKIFLNHGIRNNDGELVTIATMKDFPQKKHNLISAIIEISDMYLLAKQTVLSVFKEDVGLYLDELDIIYTPQFISRGNIGLEFTFDFQIARKDKEIVINSFNTINQTNLSKFLFSWDDIRETRQKITHKDLVSLAIINNDEKDIKSEYLEALKLKGADYILWSQRHTADNIKKICA